MNERLKELMLEAESWATANTTPETIDLVTTYDLFKGKYAELIIKDCIRIVETLPPGYKDYRDQIEDAFRRDCIATMREHFGVENETE